MTAAWSYEITAPARRDLRRLDPPVQRRVIAALEAFAARPGSADVRKLAGSEWRLRVGDWRVRFSFDAQRRTIVVARVLPRGRAYDR